MAELIVTPEAERDVQIANSGAHDMIGFGSPDRPAARPASVERFHALAFHDIPEPREGYRAATARDVEIILRLSHQWSGERPLVLQCWMGVSRSTAAALLIACALRPAVEPADWARRLRAASAEATPNPHLIALADDRLELNGRLSDAVRAIGRGTTTTRGRPFRLDLDA